MEEMLTGGVLCLFAFCFALFVGWALVEVTKE